jgi:hypothetical protein
MNVDMADLNPDVYWTVDNVNYGRKVDALRASYRNEQSHITFNYYNSAFARYDWTTEPSASFEELSALRAHQLRDNNKYIRIWYSGGADSHTMLQAFIGNGIHIDEIVIVRASPIDDFETRANNESNLRAIPYIQSIRHSIPRTRVSIVNVTADHYLDMYKNNSDWQTEVTIQDFANDPCILLGSREGIDRYTQLTMNANITELTGNDKPKLLRKDGQYYIGITDSQFNYLYWPSVKEFFLTSEMPELHAKQCYIWMETLERLYPDQAQDITHTVYSPELMTKAFRKEWYNCCRTIINYDIDLGKGWKRISPKCMIRIKEAQEHNPELLRYYLGAIKELQPSVSHYWDDFDSAITGVLAGIYTFGPYNKNN